MEKNSSIFHLKEYLKRCAYADQIISNYGKLPYPCYKSSREMPTYQLEDRTLPPERFQQARLEGTHYQKTENETVDEGIFTHLTAKTLLTMY